MKAPCVGMQGKMLPSVTTEDNGDVLTAVDGEWAKAEASGGGGGGKIVGNLVMGKNDWHTDMTFMEIKTAIDSDLDVYFRDSDGFQTNFSQVMEIYYEPEQNTYGIGLLGLTSAQGEMWCEDMDDYPSKPTS